MAFAQKEADPVLNNPTIPTNIKKSYAELCAKLPEDVRRIISDALTEIYREPFLVVRLSYLERIKHQGTNFPEAMELFRRVFRDLNLESGLKELGAPTSIIELYKKLPEDEKMLLGAHSVELYGTGVLFSTANDKIAKMLREKRKWSPESMALFKALMNDIENYYIKQKERIKSGESKESPEINQSNLEEIRRLRANPLIVFYKEAFTAGIEERIKKQEKFDAAIPATVVQEGDIPKQQREDAIKAIKHALASLPETLADLGLPPEQVIALREKLHEVTFVLATEEEWTKREYEPSAAGLCETESDRILLRIPDASIALAKIYGYLVHEILHHLSEGYSNNSNSESLHEALTETFSKLVIAKELGLPTRFTLREAQGETVPSRRFEVGSIVDFSNPSYHSLVMNDEFQELLATIGRLEWQKAYFSGDYSEVKRQVNLYLPGNKDAFAYLFDDGNIEKSIAAADLRSVSTDWTEKFDKAKRPYVARK